MSENQTTDWTSIEEEAAARIREITPCTHLMSLHAARAAISTERERCAAIARKHSGRTYKAVTHIIEDIENGTEP